MFRLTLRLTLVSVLCLGAALFLLRAQPYDNQAIRAFLLSDDCTKPCFMGIQPGITTPQDALRQLRSTDLISYVGVSESLQTVAWFWKADRSPLIDDTQIPAFFYDRDRIYSIRLYTRIRLGDLLLGLDTTGAGRIAIRRTAPLDSYNIDLYYVGNGYVLNAAVDCHHFWAQPTHLILGTAPSFITSQTSLTGLNSAKHMIATACRRRNEG